MPRMARLPILLALLALLSACAGQPAAAPAASAAPTAAASAAPAELTVFAAASLTDAFKEIGQQFGAANAATVAFNFAGSNQLAQQIGQGAPADVFASANKTQMDVAVKAGDVAEGAPRIFARNRLVVIYPHDNPGKLAALTDLAKPGLKLVLADKAVPVGQYALDFLGKAAALPEYTAAYSPTVLKNVVSYEQNVKAVLSKVSLGEADAGMVYTTDISRDVASSVGTLDIPDNLNTIASYPIAALKGAKQADLAQKFVDYVLSAPGQQALAKYGFMAAPAK